MQDIPLVNTLPNTVVWCLESDWPSSERLDKMDMETCHKLHSEKTLQMCRTVVKLISAVLSDHFEVESDNMKSL